MEEGPTGTRQRLGRARRLQDRAGEARPHLHHEIRHHAGAARRTGRKDQNAARQAIYACLEARSGCPRAPVVPSRMGVCDYLATGETIPAQARERRKAPQEYAEAIGGMGTAGYPGLQPDPRSCPNCQFYFMFRCLEQTSSFPPAFASSIGRPDTMGSSRRRKRCRPTSSSSKSTASPVFIRPKFRIAATMGDLHDALVALGIVLDAEVGDSP